MYKLPATDLYEGLLLSTYMYSSLEQYENDNSVYCATAELSTDSVDDLDPDDVIIDFQSVHMIFQHIPKYRVEFNPSQAWKSSVVFEKYNKDPMIEKAEQRTQEREEANE